MKLMTLYEELQSQLEADPRRWLVTGVAGFIGSHLLEKLLQLGQTVVGLDNFATGCRGNLEDVRRTVGDVGWRHFNFIEGDIRNPADCARAVEGVDFVLHQAAIGSVPRSIKHPLTTHQVNVDGFVNMLIAARDFGVQRFIYASSSSVYGDNPDLPKFEDKLGTPLSPYAVSKRTNELYAQTFFYHYGLETISLRYFNVFGPRQDPNGAYAAVIPKWIDRMLHGQECVIYGDGETSRDFCYVANVVQANILAATAAAETAGNSYNVAVGERTSLNQLHAALKEGIECLEPSLSIAPAQYREFRAGDIRHSLAGIERAVDRLGYAPTHAFREGLKAAISWYHVPCWA